MIQTIVQTHLFIWILQDSEGAIINGQSRETENKGKTKQNSTQYVLETTSRKKLVIKTNRFYAEIVTHGTQNVTTHDRTT
jgi:hypothetical protein